MKRSTAVLLAVAIGGLLASFVVVRTAFRLYALNKVLRSPAAGQRLGVTRRQRLGVTLKHKSLVASVLTNEVNLGSATFRVPGGTTSVQSSGPRGTALGVSNEEFQILFLSPFAPKKPSALPPEGARYPRLASYIEKWGTDPVGADIETEELRELPVLKVARMNTDEFLFYSKELCDKAGFTKGWNEVFAFTARHIRGLVRIGDSPQDRHVASASLASPDGSECVGFHLWRASASVDIGRVLDGILGSFHFTVDTIGNQDEIAKLISSAGIRHEPIPDEPQATKKKRLHRILQ